MKKKVVIVTLFGLNNYGNRLQNYALQSLLNRKGFCCDTLRIEKKRFASTVADYKARIKCFYRPLLGKTITPKMKRRIRFLAFEKRIKEVRCTEKQLLEGFLNRYDYVLYGSDQIWNTQFKSFSNLYLGYYSDKKRNIALSASFGMDRVNPGDVSLFEEGLDNFRAISVRESQGKEIIRDISGLDATVLPDPTLVVSREEWEKIETYIATPEKYAFTYFLGETPEIKNCENVLVHGDVAKEYGPSDFVYLIHHAEMVYTDSFHACVFAIIFETPFCVYKRISQYNTMMSRIYTLLEQFGFTIDETAEYTMITKDELMMASVKDRIRKLTVDMNCFLDQELGVGE